MENISVAGVAQKDGLYFIALRKPGIKLGSCWEFPGGKLEDGEGFEQALQREFMEELGVGIDVGSRLCEGVFQSGSETYRLVAFSVSLKSEDFILCEHEKAGWFAPESFAGLKFPDSDMIIVDYILSR